MAKKATKKKEPKKPLARMEAVYVPVRCPKCGSERRGHFTGSKRRLEQNGTSPVDGRAYNLIYFRNCKCLDCGQALCVRSYEWCVKLEKAAYEQNERLRSNS